LKVLKRVLAGYAMDSYIGHSVSPMVGLGLEVEQICEKAQGPNCVPDVVDNFLLYFTLLVGALGRRIR